MKKVLKAIGITLGAVFLLLMLTIAFLSYEFNFKKVEISQSIEGVYTVTMYQVGEPAWPFGPVKGEFVLRKEDKKISTYSFSVRNDGGGLSSGNATFQWENDCVKIRVCGEEQEDMLYTLGFDGTSDSEKAERINNELYTQIDENLYVPGQGTENSSSDRKESKEISPEMLVYYLSLEPGCSFLTDGGMEYRMIPVDRALDSNFYVLLGTKDGGETCAFVNPDPYNGSGGEARWIVFVNEELGFSCLAHAAGAYGSLYRTEDGGKLWVEITYPSVKAQFSDGTFYNPFVMPEKVYKKDGILYMEVGQEAAGDYYDEQGFCHGLYQSSDDGLNWEFVQNIYP